MPHRIRLRGPWNIEPLWRWVPGDQASWQQSSTDLPPGGTFTAPQRWSNVLGPDFRGSAKLSRRFHRPTGLEPDSKLWLVVGDLAWPTEIRLNEQPIASINSGRESGEEPPQESLRSEIGRLVEPQNMLILLVTAPPISAGHAPPLGEESDCPFNWLGQVWLEIE